jgi:ribosomal protein S18 acetylase RimI-like enzyme
MIVRPATLADIPDLRHGYAALVTEQQQRYPSEYPVVDAEELDNFVLAIVRALQQPQSFRAWVAEGFGQHIIGFVGGSIESRAVTKPHLYGYIHWIWVEPSERQHGIAKALLAAISGWYAGTEIAHIEAHELARDHQWESRGWRPLRTHLYIPTGTLATWAHGHPAAPEVSAAPALRKRPGRPKKRKERVQHVNGGAA